MNNVQIHIGNLTLHYRREEYRRIIIIKKRSFNRTKTNDPTIVILMQKFRLLGWTNRLCRTKNVNLMPQSFQLTLQRFDYINNPINRRPVTIRKKSYLHILIIPSISKTDKTRLAVQHQHCCQTFWQFSQLQDTLYYKPFYLYEVNQSNLRIHRLFLP